ncbi:MAG: NarK/NasA family nitrate transporter [Chloroflexi bacterium]|nr:NarK/NasA family nitrate transporter [Chloroflexota bacterium]
MSRTSTWLTAWTPEDSSFWKTTGSRIARQTLTITTVALIFSFATWFVMSAVVVRLPQIGFQFTTLQLFWLGAMPGLAGGTLRIINTFLIPIYGTRHVVSISTLLKILPCVALGLAVMNPDTPFWLFIVIALALGFGGGDFSSYMPSTSLFFPRRLQGTALGIQAGIGNFGVSLTQFVAPWIIGLAIFGALLGGSQVYERAGRPAADIWLQNAAFWFVPFLLVVGIVAWVFLRSVPVRATFRQQLDIFKDRHTYFCTITYVMTFGSFSGLAAAFPMMIRALYGGFEDPPDPLAYAFLGPLVGSLIRVVMGWPSDRWGGSIFTQFAGAGLIICSLLLIFGGYLAPTSGDQFPVFVIVMLLLFFFAGAGNASTFRQFPIIFAHSPRQGAGVIGFTAAIAAYGPFIFSGLIGTSIAATGSAAVFFWGAIAFWSIASALNFWFYTRPGKERWDFGSRWGTWWDARGRTASP